METSEAPTFGPESEWEGWKKWRASELYKKWYDKTQVGNPNDFVVVVSASSKTGVSGTGKSTLMTVLANSFDTSDEGFDAEQKATLDVGELAYERLPDIPTHSAVVADEIQGNIGTTGLDARRGMKQSSIDAINSITANRNKQLTVILGAQILKMLDKRLYPLIDAWLLIRKEPSDPEGPLARHYSVHTDDLNLTNQDWKTPKEEDLTWPELPHNHPDYAHLERLKEESKRDGGGDDGPMTTVPQHIRNQDIEEWAKLGVPQTKIAEKYDLDQSTVSRILND